MAIRSYIFQLQSNMLIYLSVLAYYISKLIY